MGSFIMINTDDLDSLKVALNTRVHGMCETAPIDAGERLMNVIDKFTSGGMDTSDENAALPIDSVKGSVYLQVGMKVKVKNNPKDFRFNAGKEKTITKDLPDFGKSRAFGLDGDDGIWCIEDFEYCVNYPKLRMR